MIDMLKETCGGEIYPAHRLDTQTTGLMVYARNQKSAAELSRQVQEKIFEKEYVCLCHGELEGGGEMVDFLYHDRIKNKSFAVKNKRNGAKEAKLEYMVVSEKYVGECRLFKVRVKLHTGRTHQIRVQFAYRKMSLVGDRKYGADDDFKNIGLWSYKISFNHPKTKEMLEFEKLPNNFMGEYISKDGA